MDIKLAAYGLDMHAASRIYFVSPVLNPQVEAQAVGRARRISQQRPVTVETLVLKGSIEEFIIARRERISREEHRKIKGILDDKPIKEWIMKSRIMPMPEIGPDDLVGETVTAITMLERETARLRTPQFIFCREYRDREENFASILIPKYHYSSKNGRIFYEEASDAEKEVGFSGGSEDYDQRKEGKRKKARFSLINDCEDYDGEETKTIVSTEPEASIQPAKKVRFA